MIDRFNFRRLSNQCIDPAIELLKKETIPTRATVEMVASLARIAIDADYANLQWAERNRFYEELLPDQTPEQFAKDLAHSITQRIQTQTESSRTFQ